MSLKAVSSQLKATNFQGMEGEPVDLHWLIRATHDKAVPGAWLSTMALLAMAGLFFCRQRQESVDLFADVSVSVEWGRCLLLAVG